MLRTFGEERYAFQIARAIVRRRAVTPFRRSGDLVEVIKAAIPTPARFGQGHPARRVFQALRIATNGELESLREGLESAVQLLAPGGRLAVISFHSLEDRISKHFIRENARGCTCPPDFPVCVCGHEPLLRSLTRRAVVASVDERCTNPRSSSGQAARGREDRRHRERRRSGTRTRTSPAPSRRAGAGRGPPPGAARPAAPAHHRRRRLGDRARGAPRRDRRAQRGGAARQHRGQPAAGPGPAAGLSQNQLQQNRVTSLSSPVAIGARGHQARHAPGRPEHDALCEHARPPPPPRPTHP